MCPWGKRVELIQGDALDVLDELTGTRTREFDLIFLDANKKQYSTYFTRIMEKELLRVGGVLVVDNTLWKGRVAELYSLSQTERVERNKELQRKGVMSLVAADKYAEAMHAFNQLVRGDARVEVVMLPVRDGLTLIRRIQ
ncbi:hypothetical protein GUITHDRAFT_152429 [Guillardia theta CCMP2712]|uniref:Caffeoyl-CoA O-methyltransferase n=1 Tax=Guillardia theta (strain CCMP2712) TaxID=905079 RepID=L1JCG4_GUITC|nr:hypothetical protein GUITHDRAFT_152429 [Guillardia theta CCMP2712]EKX46238.1 hypothetical protein GUITHDRAFT_152429 [Guillardia theta CCMP2712]|eukprot:XP_005833218.1 hypothetical protein GUITHDRAFT_152429 [Guillardia theta CCMP2712]